MADPVFCFLGESAVGKSTLVGALSFRRTGRSISESDDSREIMLYVLIVFLHDKIT
jgi:hypothetical protein